MKSARWIVFFLPAALLASSAAGAPNGSPWDFLWTFPVILFAAFVVAWGAEAAQFFMSQGLALAVLAWLQTLPEFAVEAKISWDRDAHNMIGNLTGSLRLLTGIGWPMIYGVAAFVHRRRSGKPLSVIHLEPEQSVEILTLAPAIAYFFWIWRKGTLDLADAGILLAIYAAYLFLLNRLPPAGGEEDAGDLDRVPRAVVGLPRSERNLAIAGLFVLGGLLLFVTVHPFVEGLKTLGLAAAASAGMDPKLAQFLMIQWISPFLSEFPEKLSAFKWARTVRAAPMALMNMVSSNVNQWTMLAAMLPVIYGGSGVHRGMGGWSQFFSLSTIEFDPHQRAEILLTLAQATLGFLLLANMRFHWYEAAGILALFSAQFFVPHWHEPVTVVYFGWTAIEAALLLTGTRRFKAWADFRETLKKSTEDTEKR